MRFPLDGELDFYLKKIDFYLLFENDLESPLIFVLFFKKVNKIRKKNPKCDSLFWKRLVYEKSDRIRGSSYLSGRYDGACSTPLSP